MEQMNPMRVETKNGERLAGWLLLFPLVIAFWLFTFGLVVFFLSAFVNTAHRNSFGENLFVIVAVSLVIGLLSFISWVFSVRLHDALAVYEFSEQSVAKESPFYRQEARWSQVAGWALSVNDQTWWLLNPEGRPLLSLEWHLLPSEQVKQAKAFTCKQLLHFLPYAKWIQPSLWERRHIVANLVTTSLLVSGFIIWRCDYSIFVAPISLLASLVLIVSVWIGASYWLSMRVRALFVVHGEWLSEINAGVTIHLPTVHEIVAQPYGMLIITADNQQYVVPKEFEWLVEYVKERTPHVS